MAHKYEDFHDRFIRNAFPAVDVVFDGNDDFDETNMQLEITDVRGEIIEIKLDDNHFLHLSFDDLTRCVEKFKIDFGRK